ncbi:hypothetical protein D6850_16200 [Roseovarius spongiae]|uniref:Flagellar FliJ protein n=1 Tax=Roseovarius spongiae TaxID=2320272 RepID=A0A3A8ASE7_9RHOB|nr:hypothetical protein [Roseovarius spongiae]RKF13041.1 hypothetical protein D6850_16200 [Roseovarius spongiae]
MSRQDPTGLGEVAGLLFETEQAKLRDLMRREAELRRALAELDDHRKAAAALPPTQLSAPRAVGADLLWQGWVGRRRAELNTELAQVLVRKAGRMNDLRRAFGRKAAIDELGNRARAEAREAAGKRREDAVQALGVMRPGG